MNKRIQILAVMLCLGLLVAWGGLTTVQAATIGINLRGNGTSASRTLDPPDSAGFIPQVNWNNAPGNVAGGSMPSITDSNGSVVAGASMTWTAPNTGYRQGAQVGVPTSGNTKMFYGYVEGNLAQGAQFVISGIPYPTYDIFVYTNRDGVATDTDGQVSIGATSYFFHPIVGWNGIFVKATQTTAPGTIGTAPAANFCRFTGLTGASQTIDALTIGGAQKGAAVSGIQIVPTTDIGVTGVLTSPATGTVFNLGQVVNFSATVTPASGVTVTKVEFLLDGVVVGTSTTPAGSVYSTIYPLSPLVMHPLDTPLNFEARVYASDGKVYPLEGTDCSVADHDVTGAGDPANGTASVSSGATASQVFNNNLGNGWDAYSGVMNRPEWVQFQLLTPQSINAVGYFDWYTGWSAPAGSESVKDFDLLGSNDGSNWTTLFSQRDLPFNLADIPGTSATAYRGFHLPAAVGPYGYYRFYIASNHGYPAQGLIELEFLSIPTLAAGTAVLVNPTGTSYGSSAPMALTANVAGFTEALSKVYFYSGMQYLGEGTSLGPTTYKLDWAPPGVGSYTISFMVVTVSGKARASNNTATVIVPAYVTPEGGGTGTGFDNAFTLAQAIAAANANVGGAMQIFLKAGTYDVTTTLSLTAPAALYGGFVGTETLPEQRSQGDPYTENVAKLDGKGTHQILLVGAPSSFDRVTFANGNSGGNGGAIRATSQLTLTDCVITDCRASLDGGGIYDSGSASSAYRRCRFLNNTAGRTAGGLWNFVDQVATAVTECQFIGNEATNGDGGGLVFSQGYIWPTDVLFKNNRAPNGYGGGLCCLGGGSNYGVIRCTFEGNSAMYGGGFAERPDGYVLRCFDTAFIRNTATEEGGAIYWAHPYYARLVNCTLLGNRTTNGTTDGAFITGRGAPSNCYVANDIFADHPKLSLNVTGGFSEAGFDFCNNLFVGGSDASWTVPYTAVSMFYDSGNNFVDAVGGNVDLVASAPAIGKGVVTLPKAGVAAIRYAAPLDSRYDWKRRPFPLPPNAPPAGCAELGTYGNVSVFPSPVSFGSVLVGEATTATLSLSVTGGNSPITVTTATITGSTAFTIDSVPFSSVNPLVLRPGDAPKNMVVRFTPPTSTSRVTYSGVLSITSDAANNPTTVNLSGTGALSDFPGTAPTVQITAQSLSPTASFPITFEVTFSEGVTGFTWSDIQWTGSVSTANMTGTLVPHGVTGADYTIVISAVTVLNGTLTPHIPAGAAKSVAFNENLASTGDPTITYDNANMGVKILTAQGPITDATTVTYTLTFTQNVQINAFPTGLLSLTGTSAGSEIKHVFVTNPSTAWQVQIATGDSGTLNLGLTDDDSILSVVGAKKLNGTGSATLYGNMVTVDKTSPTLVSVQRAFGAKRGTNASSVVFLVTFSEPVSGLDIGDFTVTSSGTGTAVRSATVIGGLAYVVCDVGTTIGPFALSVKTAATMSDSFGRGYVEGAPDPNEDFYILSVAPGETAAQTWSLY